MKKLIYILIIAVVAIGGFYALNSYIYKEKQAKLAADYKDVEYAIDGERVSISTDGVEFFGNELAKDLDGDGVEDMVFLVTRNGGGSGTFFYVVGAIKTEGGYTGTDAVFLGDRIAPQTTVSGPGRSAVINYADRAQGEPMTAQSSVGKSKRLLLDPQSLVWGEVAIDFEGEADPSRMTLGMKEWVWMRTELNDGTTIEPKAVGRFTISFTVDGKFSAKTDCNSMFGSYQASAGRISFGDVGMTKMFCEGSQEDVFALYLRDSAEHLFTSKGELVLGLKFDSGSVIFR